MRPFYKKDERYREAQKRVRWPRGVTGRSLKTYAGVVVGIPRRPAHNLQRGQQA